MPHAGGHGRLSGHPAPAGPERRHPGGVPAEHLWAVPVAAAGQADRPRDAGPLAGDAGGPGVSSPDYQCAAGGGQRPDDLSGPPGTPGHRRPPAPGGGGAAGADPRGVSASAVHRPGSGEGAALPAGEGIRQHGPVGGGAAPADGGGAGRAGTQPRASAAAAGGGAAGLCGPAGHHRRTGVPQPERAANAADPGDGRDPVPVPGRPGAGGKREPTLSAPAVAGDPGCHPGQCGPAGGPGLRPDDGGGTVLRGLGCRKGGGDDVTTPPSSRLRWHEYQLLRRKEMT